MPSNENVSAFYYRIALLKSGAHAALEDKYDNADLNDGALESFIRGLPDKLSVAVENQNLRLLQKEIGLMEIGKIRTD